MGFFFFFLFSNIQIMITTHAQVCLMILDDKAQHVSMDMISLEPSPAARTPQDTMVLMDNTKP